MVKFKNALLIVAIGLAVVVAGCAGPQSKVSETAQPTPTVQTTVEQTTTVQTSGYQLVPDVKTLQDCIVYSGTKQSCS